MPESDNGIVLQDSPHLIAYCTRPEQPMDIVRATQQRDWMDDTVRRFAYRCLPLLIANQNGWHILNSHPVQVTWNGNEGLGDVEIKYLTSSNYRRVTSHFGHGIVTWTLPYLFRTSPGYNLHVRGPVNLPKDGVAALEGIVETDWTPATFTMNWKITRPNHPIVFEAGEPICLIAPQKRGELEHFVPEIRNMSDDAELEAQYRSWSDSRSQFLKDLRKPTSDARELGWQRDYFQGGSPGGVQADEHQTRLNLRDFEDKRHTSSMHKKSHNTSE